MTYETKCGRVTISIEILIDVCDLTANKFGIRDTILKAKIIKLLE